MKYSIQYFANLSNDLLEFYHIYQMTFCQFHPKSFGTATTKSLAVTTSSSRMLLACGDLWCFRDSHVSSFLAVTEVGHYEHLWCVVISASSVTLSSMKIPCIYILTNITNSVLYTGVTSNLPKRLWEHKNHVVAGFTKTYHVSKLVYFESFETMLQAITREKQIKAGSRKKKELLINTLNPNWSDLTDTIELI
jgi:putative endonuclease